MFKKVICSVLLIFIGFYAEALAENGGAVISNYYFSFKMPEDTKNTYSVEKFDKGIYISEKKSAKSGIGGFAFGVKIFKNPKDYVDIPGSKKLGELKDTKGVIYDMVLMRPSEVQYEDGEDVEKNYNRLYELGDNVEITGVNGNKYTKNKGMKGKDLYGEILKQYKIAIENKSDSKENPGSIYPYNAKNGKNLLKKTGYSFYDINSDGIDELIIGEGYNVYDVYTMVNRRPEHVISASAENKYYICYDMFLCNEYSSAKNETATKVSALEKNSTKLNPTITFIRNGKSRYFVYGNSTAREEVSAKSFKERLNMFDRMKPDYIPLAEIEQN